MISRDALWALSAVVCAWACDPLYEYCVEVHDCTSGDPIGGVKVRFDHEGLVDQRTDARGHACASNVGDPPEHDVRILLEKDAYRSTEAFVHSSGRGLDVALCMCPQAAPACSEQANDAGAAPDTGASD